MKIEAIPDDLVDELLRDESEKKGPYPPPPQFGPLRYFENDYRCASRGCGSPTHFKVQGIPYCMTHALRKLNDMLINLGVEK